MLSVMLAVWESAPLVPVTTSGCHVFVHEPEHLLLVAVSAVDM